jgi:Domain of unknown function (DUF4357)
MRGRSIKIFLIDGTASGVRTAELGLSTIKAIVVPRASLSAVTARPELQKTGVYVLVGADAENPGRKKIYVGEGDTILTRLGSHSKDEDKEFWDEAVVFVSKDENLTKAHGRFLEARLISLAKTAKRATIITGTAPPEQGKLPEPDEVEMNEFIAASQAQAPLQSPPEFTFVGDGYSATCVVDLNAGQFIVKSGSKARKQETPSLQPTYKNLRLQLVTNGVLADGDSNSWVFSQDYAFSAITAAAQVVSGTTVSGRVAWKLRDTDITFAEWEDQKIPSEAESS